MAQVDAPNNERHDMVLVTLADGTQEHVAIPDELQAKQTVEISLSAETIEALGQAIAKAVKKR